MNDSSKCWSRPWHRRGREPDVSISQPIFQRVAIIGLGLIGGSLAVAIKSRGLASVVVGADKRPDELALARQLNIIDIAAASLEEAVTGSDLVVLAVPVRATRQVLEDIQPWLDEAAILTDVGSTKSSFVADVEAVFRSEEHTSELQSRPHLVCRLLLEKKKNTR